MMETHIVLLLYLAFVGLYGWSSNLLRANGRGGPMWENFSMTRQAYPPRDPLKPTVRFFGQSQLLGHDGDDLWRAGVCPLGKVAFVLWTVALGLAIVAPPRRSLGVFFAMAWVATVALTWLMNFPLLVRSAPAFLVLATLLYLLWGRRRGRTGTT